MTNPHRVLAGCLQVKSEKTHLQGVPPATKALHFLLIQHRIVDNDESDMQELCLFTSLRHLKLLHSLRTQF